MLELEEVFQVPVIESYGMTEASHQIASNPMPPDVRKTGTVGIPTGPEVSIMDREGKLLSQGEIGEIVIRGKNVIDGYMNNPEANEKSFTNGWFRTGDEGYFDNDNYLVIKDRIKEIINRGGEKISPREVDDVLLDHPKIKQAVTFSVPDDRLGEEIGVAIVLKKGERVEKWDVQSYVADRLADFKVPRYVTILDEIPKSPTGKIQRLGLVKKLVLVDKIKNDIYLKKEIKPPITKTEKKLWEIWSNVLQIKRINVDDNYFQLGGDSILAGQIVSEINRTMGIKILPLVIFLHAPTIEEMAKMIDDRKFELAPASLVALQSNGRKPPIYFVHACEGEVLFLTKLSSYLGLDQPFYALRARGLEGIYPPHDHVEGMAVDYTREILATNPNGPYILGGAGVGGLIAYEMAQLLTSQSKEVFSLILVDTIPPKFPAYKKGKNIKYYFNRAFIHLENGELTSAIISTLSSLYKNIAASFITRYKIWKNIQKAAEKYVPNFYTGKTLLILPQMRVGYYNDHLDRVNGWSEYIKEFDYYIINGRHLKVFKEPYVKELALSIKRHIKYII
jgi:thioesterase domain-containing protein